MADHTLLQNAIGAVLQILQTLEAPRELARNAAASDSYVSLLTRAGGLADTDEQEALALGSQKAGFADDFTPQLLSLAQAYIARLSAQDGNGVPIDLVGLLKEEVPLKTEDLTDALHGYEYDVLANGQVTISKHTGPFGRLYHKMQDDAETVSSCGVTFGGSDLTAENGNVGKLTVSGGSMAARSRTLSGTFHFECVDEQVTSPKVSVVLELDKPRLSDGATLIEGTEDLTPDQQWQDGPTGGNFTIKREGLVNPTVTDPNSIISKATTAPTVATPKTGDSDLGKHYIKITRQASPDPDWLVEFFNQSSRGVSAKVGSKTHSGTSGSDTDQSLELANGTTIKYDINKANAATAMGSVGNTVSDIEIDIKQPRVGDKWTRTVTNDEAGNFATKGARYLDVEFPTASPSTWDNTKAADILT